jgi:hypothetical protein
LLCPRAPPFSSGKGEPTKFRSSEANANPAGSDLIDKQTKEIRQDDDATVYRSLEELADDLPDHSPRFVLLSYPLTLVRFPSSSSTACLSAYLLAGD